MGGVFCRFTVGRAGAADANARYITRETATGKGEKSVLLHNYPQHVRGGDYDEQRRRICEYNRQREQDELARKRRGGGTTRTHYRCKLSFEVKVSTEKAHEMVKEYLEKNFPTDGVVAILSYHHFSSPRQALTEMDRVCGKGPIVLFTFDPREARSFWLADYFPEVWQAAFDAFPPIVEVEGLMKEVTGRGVCCEEFSLPHDLADRFVAAGWRRPEVYLEAEVRAGMSAFRLADQRVVERWVMNLGKDLESGEWHRNYGQVLEQESYDAGYRFVCVEAAPGSE